MKISSDLAVDGAVWVSRASAETLPGPVVRDLFPWHTVEMKVPVIKLEEGQVRMNLIAFYGEMWGRWETTVVYVDERKMRWVRLEVRRRLYA